MIQDSVIKPVPKESVCLNESVESLSAIFHKSFFLLGTDLLQVAAHEIGHVLGLQHSIEPGAVMSPFYTFSYPLQLSEDDKRGIQSLYGSKHSDDRRKKEERPPKVTETNEVESTVVSYG